MIINNRKTHKRNYYKINSGKTRRLHHKYNQIINLKSSTPRNIQRLSGEISLYLTAQEEHQKINPSS